MVGETKTDLAQAFFGTTKKNTRDLTSGRGLAFGGSTEFQVEEQYDFSPTTTNVRVVAPQITRTDARVFAPTTIYTIESPNATVTSKKDATSAPVTRQQGPNVEASPSLRKSQSQKQQAEGGGDGSLVGGSSASLLAIGAVAIVGGIAYLRFGKKVKK